VFDNPEFRRMKLNIPLKTIKTISQSQINSVDDFIKVTFAVFIGKLNNKESYDIGYSPNNFVVTPGFSSLIAQVVPFRVNLDYKQNCSELIKSEIESFN